MNFLQKTIYFDAFAIAEYFLQNAVDVVLGQVKISNFFAFSSSPIEKFTQALLLHNGPYEDKITQLYTPVLIHDELVKNIAILELGPQCKA